MLTRLNEAIALHRKGEYSQAQAACEALLREGVVSGDVFNLLGASLFRQGNFTESLEKLQEACRLAPTDAEAHFNRGVVLQALERNYEALGAYRAALALSPTYALVWLRSGTCHLNVGDFPKSLACLTRCSRLDENTEDIFSLLGSAAFSSGDYEAAVDAYRKALVRKPRDVGTIGLLGRALLASSRIDEAEATFAGGLAIAPDEAQFRQGTERCRLFRDIRAARGRPGVPRGLVVRGALSGASGYTHMTRNFIHHMLREGMPIRTIGVHAREPWQPLGTDALEYLDGPVDAAGVLNFMIPALVDPVPDHLTVTYSMFEGSRIPDYWAAMSRRHDFVFVPARASARAWVESGFPEERVRVCPLGVDEALAASEVEPLMTVVSGGRPLSSFRTRFLNVSDFIPRKNLDGLLRAWLRATTPGDDTLLLLKAGKGNAGQTEQMHALVRRTEQAVGKGVGEAAPIVLLNMRLTDAQMTSLFACATHYWSMSHGEGWDLPMTQAGVMGLQLIAPEHSAYEDYLDPSIAWMIPSRLTPAYRPYTREHWFPFYGLDWWQPDEDYAVELLRRIIRGAEAPRPGARERLLGRFSWRAATRTLIDQLAEVGALRL